MDLSYFVQNRPTTQKSVVTQYEDGNCVINKMSSQQKKKKKNRKIWQNIADLKPGYRFLFFFTFIVFNFLPFSVSFWYIKSKLFNIKSRKDRKKTRLWLRLI